MKIGVRKARQSRQAQDWLMNRYLSIDPQALKNSGDFQKFKMVCLDAGLEEEEIPCFKTFTRWLEARKPGNPTRVSAASFTGAKNMDESELLQQLLKNTVNYDEVEGWMFFHKLDGLRIDEKKIWDAIGPFYPATHTTAATKEIKAFITGYLYARRNKS